MKQSILFLFLIEILFCLCGCSYDTEQSRPADTIVLQTASPAETVPQETSLTTETTVTVITTTTVTAFDIAYVPEYHGEPYCEINNSLPFFKERDITEAAYEFYSPLDGLGRCGVCMAFIGQELMPVKKRGSIGAVKPSGWRLVRYDGIVEGNYLFNRCHLIGYLLTGENANVSNLITGTRYMNTEGMLPFEILTADYIRKTGNHVLYRVTPIFEGGNLLVTGVLMEALSVEDSGDGIRFNVFCYNVQPQIAIDYATGENHLMETDAAQTGTTAAETTAIETTETQTSPPDEIAAEYILNIKTKRFHMPDCPSVADIKEKNRQAYSGDRETLIEEGYVPCQRCKP